MSNIQKLLFDSHSHFQASRLLLYVDSFELRGLLDMQFGQAF